MARNSMAVCYQFLWLVLRETDQLGIVLSAVADSVVVTVAETVAVATAEAMVVVATTAMTVADTTTATNLVDYNKTPRVREVFYF
jgi:hypothetical protein